MSKHKSRLEKLVLNNKTFFEGNTLRLDNRLTSNLVFFLLFISSFYYFNSSYYPSGLSGYVAVDSIDVGELWDELTYQYWPIRGDSEEVVFYSEDNSSVLEDYRYVKSEKYESFYLDTEPNVDHVLVKRFVLKNKSLDIMVIVDDVVVEFVTIGPSNDYFYYDETFITIPGEFIKKENTNFRLVYDYPLETQYKHNYQYGHLSLHYYLYARGSRIIQILLNIIKSIIIVCIFYILLLYYKVIFRSEAGIIIVLFILSSIPSAIFGYYILGGMPHTPDGVTRLFQAKLMLEGKLYLTSISSALLDSSSTIDADFYYLMDNEIFIGLYNGIVFGKYNPIFSFFIALGQVFRASYLVNPIIGGLSAISLYFLGLEFFNNRSLAIYSVLFMAVSPFYILMSSSYMINPLSMLFTLLFVLFYLKSLKQGNLLYAFLAGLLLGGLFNIRLFNALLLSFVFGVYSLRKKEINLNMIGSFIAGFFIMLGFYLCYNYVITGNLFLTPFLLVHETETPGFGIDKGFINTHGSPGHTLVKAFLNTRNSLNKLDGYVFGGIGLIYILFLLFLFSKKDELDILFSSIIIILVFGYFFYYYHCVFFGPRYYYELLPFISLLAIKTLSHLEIGKSKKYILPGIFTLCLIFSYSFQVSNIALNCSYHQFDTRYIMLFSDLKDDIGEDSIVFVREKNEYKIGFNLNDWSFDDKVIFLKDNFYDDLTGFVDINFPGRRCYVAKVVEDKITLEDCG